MEKVEGIPGHLPPFAPFPASQTLQNLLPAQWQACLDAWIFCVEFRLRLLPEHFHHFKLNQASSGISFLSSYFLSWTVCHDSPSKYKPSIIKEHNLHRHCLLLFRRLLLEADTPYDCSERDFFILLANASAAFRKSKVWNDTLQQVWKRHERFIYAAAEDMRSYSIKMMAADGSDSYEPLQISISQITALSRGLPQAGRIFMTGFDFVDSLISRYNDPQIKLDASNLEDVRKHLTENLFICLKALVAGPNPTISLLLDNLYGLKANAEERAKINPNKPTLLSSLVCLTSYVRHLELILATSSYSRGDSVLQFLRSYKTKMSYLHPIKAARIIPQRKGKGKARVDHHSHEMHIHKAAQVSTIHELFPDTPTSYVLRLLDHFSDDVEAVTAALLEPETLPGELRNSYEFAVQGDKEPALQSELTPHSTPQFPRGRRNVFDDDEFDKLRISASQVHIGRKERSYEEPSDPSEKAKKKAAIMAALAAFDSDDDERDDTYDVADVGGAVDNTVDTDARPRARSSKEREEIDANEQILFSSWRSHSEMFDRDSKTRLSKPRQQLKIETGMGDEQIEGWALMLSRDAGRVRKLEKKYFAAADLGGEKKALKPTKWSGSRSGTATEEETDHEAGGEDGPTHGEGTSRGRSFRSGDARGKGSTSGPSRDVRTQNARKRKEQGRGRGGANHNRREGRARKIGSGFGSVPSG